MVGPTEVFLITCTERPHSHWDAVPQWRGLPAKDRCLWRAWLKVHEEAVMAWVLREAVFPDLAAGTRVLARHRGQDREGWIIGFDLAKAYYLVCVPELGHRLPNTSGTGRPGTHIPYELVEPWPEDREAPPRGQGFDELLAGPEDL